MTKTSTITVEDVEYNVSELSEQIQQKVTIYDMWRGDAEKMRIELVKVDAAMREFGNQIARDVQQANLDAEMADEANGAAEPTVETTETTEPEKDIRITKARG